MSGGNDVEPYGYGDAAGDDDAESAAERLREVINSLGDIEARIEATEGVRRPILDKEDGSPGIPDADYPDLSDSLVTVRSLIDAMEKVSADLDQLVDELRAANEDAHREAVGAQPASYPSWGAVPDVLLEIEYPPLSWADQVEPERRTRMECPACGRHFRAASSGSPNCVDCRDGKPPRTLPAVDQTVDQRVSPLGERC